ncbi:glucose-6-phosphate isomerase [Neisseria dentiae]|uniref:Glucose-6-phosphate isomerase n=1 Tax=Neisseria dentiae TaxID=194197 RepID=A0A1X3DF22_9NEIS|nr:glucose-6-phosphate isomerase [Neisseria dentiae]OSI18321.1 glucose-6-phosphate isomerase [Neisseria dentiae]QMT44510.1 glucose-6-phosphate isomerase [Neisseria dentiae]STZ50203.1 glucose-6-phosphate isomerase [Neisseria dentiae]
MNNITQSAAWQNLQAHQINTANIRMRELFEADPQRFDNMHETLHGLLFDYSKNRISEETLQLLCELAETAGLEQQAEAMRRGGKINISEKRAVLHTALRLPADAAPVLVDGENVIPAVHRELDRALAFAESLINGVHTGATGKRITDFVHIGIGGSDLGPQLAVQALQPFHKNVHVHFVSNSDDANIAQVLAPLNAETTVFCVASKSFGTPETLLNAHAARAWFRDSGLREADIARHFAAISSDVAAARNFGIAPDNVFAMFDWVGGRYSVWSAIGLPVMVAVGSTHFRKFLSGAHAMDEHFFNTPLRRNIPVLLALIGIWYGNFCGAHGQAVVPYSHNLRRLPGYLQQLDMESNGKRRTLHGDTVECHTGGIVFGEEGVNCQHAFFQLLHQGTRLIPADFIVPMRTPYKIGRQHRFTVANAFAQTEALMRGKTLEEARAELAALPEAEREELAPQKEFPGNQPSNSILIEELNPFNLGMLIAMYEHKVFAQGAIWGINSFDQWGVEYGKVLAKNIEPELAHTQNTQHDTSTNGLIAFYHKCNP